MAGGADLVVNHLPLMHYFSLFSFFTPCLISWKGQSKILEWELSRMEIESFNAIFKNQKRLEDNQSPSHAFFVTGFSITVQDPCLRPFCAARGTQGIHEWIKKIYPLGIKKIYLCRYQNIWNEADSVCWSRASGYGVSPLTKYSDQDGRNLMWRVEPTLGISVPRFNLALIRFLA